MIKTLQGKKTYVVVAMVLLIVICESVLGIDIPGVDVVDPFPYIMGALGLGSLRAGVKKGEM